MDDYYSYDYETFDTSDTDDYDEMLMKMQYEENLSELWGNCIEPSITQIMQYIIKLVGINFLCRFGWIVLSFCHIPNGEHLISFLSGWTVLYLVIGYGYIYLLSFGVISYILLKFLINFFKPSKKSVKSNAQNFISDAASAVALNENDIKNKIGYSLGLICIIGLIICEISQSNINLWHQIRGIQMILTMKATSLAFDLDSKKIIKCPGILEYFGYLFCPANCVLGPWIPYEEYQAIFKGSKFNIKWIFWTLTNIVASLIFLLLSNCFISLLAPSITWKWFSAYKDAFSFRNSHYFVSFLSQATMTAAGFVNPISNRNYEISPIFGYIVTKPWTIELPKSLVQIVVNWNIPMHRWLKTYVFKVIKPHSTALAIFITYLVSSLLHGLNLQLYAVLLSLGFYTFVEYKLRQKLANIFNACISSTDCKRICLHENKWCTPICLVINIFLSLITVMHLSYLGVMFEASTSIQEQGYSIEHALNKWKSLDFLSHWTMLFSYIFYLII
ncbi:protein-serine O-palmitoleoyltransferase porcupine [Condylostylus longicornis]|uniref:protein-serine O-palmitoleoyltransferase porcupine n=1 Tax=Condylostylus longicornis TaxID=2530218 RepID=UPI00244E44FF|nr:protein-serine O-palmitoleoyltransferase porcupine [Condylostylus longicornis]XP_055381049.1 protein-serine O-palmitoleoyltransferase porcupine [Condylostylus longicornis]